MARLTIEDKWWSDPRRGRLVKYFGGESQLADGLATQAWRMAQEFWKIGRGLVPKPHFERLEHSQTLIEAGLAEVRGEYVYIRGSSAFLEWIAEQREIASEAGKQSAKIRREKYGSAQPPTRTTPERPSNDSRTEPNALEPSVSVFDSAFGSKKRNTNTNTARTGVRATYSPEFEKVWEEFGRIGKKADAKKAFEEGGLSPPELEQLSIAIVNYLVDCQKNERTQMYLATFLRDDWREWLRPKTPVALQTVRNPELEALDRELAEQSRQYGRAGLP